jgi:hypothetical protein
MHWEQALGDRESTSPPARLVAAQGRKTMAGRSIMMTRIFVTRRGRPGIRCSQCRGVRGLGR